MSRPYAEVIGDPIAQSKSPVIHNFWLGKLGIDAEYRRCHVRAEELQDYLYGRLRDENWRGCNVTMPHKQTIVPMVDRLEDSARSIGAVNTVTATDYHLIGHNTDGPGFMEPLHERITGRDYRFAYIVGGGGAARAICDALASEEFLIFSYSRDPKRTAIELQDYVDEEDVRDMACLEFAAGRRIEAGNSRIDLFINASPLGMTGHDDLQVKLNRFPEGTIVYDIITSPSRTALLMQAKHEGLPTIDGLAMLIGQAAIAFEKFFGRPAPREHDAELRPLLTV